jgi:hypothetical protein
MNQTLASILSTHAATFDAVQDAREIRAALDSLTSKTPSIVADVVSPSQIVRKADDSNATRATASVIQGGPNGQ